ncbi:AAA family ATPase [Flectobacillus roseus]|uniref:SMC family ATPase n=1 Tax=Flectobacillus roseus TaxID=502259 RepID=A0ABT6YAW1_9BACT|nr:SMC family ATPase [Flectobacillus roseus]MDI9860716.1 SMC family ATPase [Flectobacillus roseus]
MIPIKLSIKGLYSYRETQVVDFTKLTEASIFGIFGKVGSGKSSILEAITFALYGDTERMNKSGDDRNYNMMNLRSDELLIDFECRAGKDNHLYRFTVKGRRNSKKFDDVKTFERKTYQWMPELSDWAPIEVENASEKIIGLSYENFKRTIIIPQGRFQEFIELPLSKRTQMMNEIFQLERFDLAAKVKVLKETNEKQLEHLNGKIAQLGQSTPEQLEAVKDQILALQTLLGLKNQALNDKVADEKSLDWIAKLFKSLEETVKQLQILEAQIPDFETRENRLKVYQKVLMQLKPLLAQQQARLAEQQKDSLAFTHKTAEQQTFLQQIQQSQAKLDELKPAFEQKENLLKEAEEWSWALKWKQATSEKLKLQERLEKGKLAVEQQRSKIQNGQTERQQIEEGLQKIKSQLVDLHKLSQVATWFGQKRNLLQQRQHIIDAGKEAKQKTEGFEQQLKAIGQDEVFQGQITQVPESNQRGVLVEQLKQDFQQKIDFHQQHIAQFETQKALQAYANALHDDEPCPLCGAIHHPAKLTSSEDFSQKIQAEKNAQKAWQNRLQRIEQLNAQWDAIEQNIAVWNAERNKQGNLYKDIQTKIQEHDQAFVWSEFAKDDEEAVQKAFAFAEQQQKEINTFEEKRNAQEQQLQVWQKDLEEKFLPTLQKIEVEISAKDSEVNTTKAQIQRLDMLTLEKETADSIAKHIQRLQNQYQDLVKNVEQLQKDLQLLQDKNNRLEGEIVALKQNLEQHQKVIQDFEKQLQSAMNEMGYVSQQEVEQILAWNLAIDAEQKAIETFKVQWQATQQHHKSLSEETKGLRYDVEIHQQLLADIASLQQEINTLQAEAGALKGRQMQLEQDLATQADLLKEKEALEIRRTDIDTLAKLFKSQGFVGFVSGMYLQNLCNQANERFSKMTRQALQLEIYETRPSEFDFRVRDLLNEGRTRAVKTLSGGQKFQVALCLALALADNIHAQTQSTNNFFFLDEGFGSLDKDSLTEVFETLKSLRKENRIVGVISHVEDLQQEIESYITVENHPEMGSQIKC